MITLSAIVFVSNAVIATVVILLARAFNKHTGMDSTFMFASNVTLILAILTFIYALFIADWSGIGLIPISVGALLVPLCMYICLLIYHVQKNKHKIHASQSFLLL